jgi:hypothetical protein
MIHYLNPLESADDRGTTSPPLKSFHHLHPQTFDPGDGPNIRKRTIIPGIPARPDSEASKIGYPR